MNLVIVDLALAVLCIGSPSGSNVCYPALVGHDTPPGLYSLEHVAAEDERYGGDVLMFKERKTGIFAVHRVIDVPGQRRHELIASNNAADRVITAGCVNVSSDVYAVLLDCCSKNATLVIR